jgi:hypothetical protein
MIIIFDVYLLTLKNCFKENAVQSGLRYPFLEYVYDNYLLDSFKYGRKFSVLSDVSCQNYEFNSQSVVTCTQT